MRFDVIALVFYFETRELLYQNSGDWKDRRPAGIGPLDTIDSKRVECLLAVCRDVRPGVAAASSPRPADREVGEAERSYVQALEHHRRQVVAARRGQGLWHRIRRKVARRRGILLP